MIHEQQITADGAVFSQQRLPYLGPAQDPHLAGTTYWAFLRRFGWPILTVAAAPAGAIRISLRPGLLLLAFHPPQVVPWEGGLALRYPIDRGAAVDPAHTDQGYLQMGIAPGTISLTVAGYYPNLLRLSLRIYEWTQSALHLRVARGYLPLLAKRLHQEAKGPCSI